MLEEVSDEDDRYASLQTDFSAGSEPASFTLKDFGLTVDASGMDSLDIEVISNDSGSDQTQKFDNVAVSDLKDWKVTASGSEGSRLTDTVPSNQYSGGSYSSSASGFDLTRVLLLLAIIAIIAVVIVVVVIAVKKHKKAPKPSRQPQWPQQPGQAQWQQPQPQQRPWQQPGQAQQPPLNGNTSQKSAANGGQSSQQRQDQYHQ